MELDGEMMSGPLSLVPLLRSRSLALSLFRSLSLSASRFRMLDANLVTGDSILDLIGHRNDDGTARYEMWRFDVISKTPLSIRAGTSSAPFVWPTGEFVEPNESVLVDVRFIRRCEYDFTLSLSLSLSRGSFVL